ncbi:MAG: peptidylprolyl isomerase [Gemmataceae bacterium]
MRDRGDSASRRYWRGQAVLALLAGLTASSVGMAAPPTAPIPPSAQHSDYHKRVVAYIHGNIAITRAELGEYLLQRQGAEKLDLLLNKRVIEHACRQRGVVVTARDVEAALVEDMSDINVDREAFLTQVLRRYGKTLYEWKEDVIRPRLMLTKLCQDRVQVSEQEVRDAFEAAYGEKVECRMIVYPLEKEQEITRIWEKVKRNPDDFEAAAQTQPHPYLRANGGAIKPIGRHHSHPEVEQVAFRLQPGEVSECITSEEGIAFLKCVRRIPADGNRSFEHEQEALRKQVFDKKVQELIPELFQQLLQEGAPEKTKVENWVHDPAVWILGYVYQTEPVTREDLGEYLIARQGAEKLELLVNKRIIEHACSQLGVQVTAKEIDAALDQDCEQLQVDRATFTQNILQQHGKSLFEWREDVIKPRLLLAKLCEKQVTIAEEDLLRAFAARYGEKIDCRVILFPRGQEKIAFRVWDEVRNNPVAFDKAANSQCNPYLAARGGAIQPVGRYSATPEIEKAAFALQPGEVSHLVETPEGPIIIKCVRRLPPEPNQSLDAHREALKKEVFAKKVQQAIPTIFDKLRKEADPKLYLKKQTAQEDLLRDVQRELEELTPTPGGKK